MKSKPPHNYAIAASTFRDLQTTMKKQAICISGESGAGKTINTKDCMAFLTQLQNVKVENGRVSLLKKAGGGVEDKIMACNPILEAFGNAKTVRNDNSSRFGKYVSLLVNINNWRIIGATIDNYLLEKSRVTFQTLGERNFHIFY